MKRIILIAGAMLVCGGPMQAQFKEPFKTDPSVSQQMRTGGLLSGLLDPSKFTMRHTYSLSYSTFGGGRGVSLGEYTNSMHYDLSDNLNLETDISVTHSPFGTFSDALTRDLTGVRLSRVALNYRPTENTFITFQFRQLPSYGYYPGYGYFGYGGYSRYGWFDRPFMNDWER